jgi:hypothetical protein
LHFFVYTFNFSFVIQASSVESIWIEGTDLPNSRTELKAANLEEAVYVIGGFTLDDKITDIVEMYNSIGNTWVQNIKSLP